MTPSEKSDALRAVRDFLIDNEQYGDDWSEELDAIDEIINDYMATDK